MRTVQTIQNEANKTTAIVYFNAEWSEYVVKFSKDGRKFPNADYHTDDREDAISTAKHWTANS